MSNYITDNQLIETSKKVIKILKNGLNCYGNCETCPASNNINTEISCFRVYDEKDKERIICELESFIKEKQTQPLPGLITKEQRQQIIESLESCSKTFNSYMESRYSIPVYVYNDMKSKIDNVIEILQPEPEEEQKSPEYLTPLQAMRWVNHHVDIVWRFKGTNCMRFSLSSLGDNICELPDTSKGEWAYDKIENTTEDGKSLKVWFDFTTEHCKGVI